MRGISVFLYSVKQGIKSMRKNRMFTLASIGTMAACLFLFGMFYFIVSNFNHMVKEVETSVGVTVFFEEGISQEQIDSIGEAIKAREEVDHMDFISAEKAWDQFVKDNFKENPELVNSFGTDNPLKDSASWAEIFSLPGDANISEIRAISSSPSREERLIISAGSSSASRSATAW